MLLPNDEAVIKPPACTQSALLRQLEGIATEEMLLRLLQLLDTEVRLITPTSSASALGSTAIANGATNAEPAYQLTHDYLVPTTRKRKDWHSRVLVTRLIEADTSDVVDVLEAIEPHRAWVVPKLLTAEQDSTQTDTQSNHRKSLHVGMAMIDSKPELLESLLPELEGVQDRNLLEIALYLKRIRSIDDEALFQKLKAFAVEQRTLAFPPRLPS